MKVIKNIKPRDIYHIRNDYVIFQTNDEFVINIYYLYENKIQINVRKINNNLGWNNKLLIKIFDDKNNIEIFDVGSSLNNSKKINIYSTIVKFYVKENKQLKIPKIIFQTNKSRYLEQELAYNSVLTFLECNPTFEYRFFNDKECRQFIKDNFNNEYLYYYDIIYPGAFKADFFRYCYLYVNGGFYFDNKSILLKNLNDILSENDELVLCQDHHKSGLYNAVMMSIPKHKLFFNLINKIIYKIRNFNEIFKPYTNVNNYNRLDTILSLSGPNLLFEEFKNLGLSYNNHILMKHEILGNYKNYKNLVVKYKNNIILYKNYHNFNIEDNNHYSKLWKKNQVLYKNHFFNNDYHFLITPNKNNLQLKFYLLNNKILVISNNIIVHKSEIRIIDDNSNYYTLDLYISKFNYNLITYPNEHLFDYSIKNINFSNCNSKIQENLDIQINKIYNEYYLVIFNNNKIDINNLKLIIDTYTIKINYNIENIRKEYYKIINITDLFN